MRDVGQEFALDFVGLEQLDIPLGQLGDFHIKLFIRLAEFLLRRCKPVEHVVERPGQLFVFVTGGNGTSYFKIPFGHVVGHRPKLPNGPKNQALRDYVEDDDRTGAADQAGNNDPETIHKDRFADFTAKVPQLDNDRSDGLVESKCTRGGLGIVAGQTAIRRFENPHVRIFRRSVPPCHQNIFIPVLVGPESFDSLGDLFAQLRKIFLALFSETNPGNLRIVRVPNLSDVVQRRESLTAVFELEVAIRQYSRPRPPGIEEVFLRKLTHPHVQYRQGHRQDQKHGRPKGQLDFPRQRQRPQPQQL